MQMSTKDAIVFVTVGTTRFNTLVSLVSSKESLKIFRGHGFNRVVIQNGTGLEPQESSVPGMQVEYFNHKPSTYADIKSASLVISHAGSGSILDALEQNKPLVAVVNPDLMGNHQTELARHLALHQHLVYCTIDTLLDTLDTLDIASFKPLPPGEPHKFGQFLDHAMGFR